jgi:ABC-type multidrug transport system fused ATPase/permease subunit
LNQVAKDLFFLDEGFGDLLLDCIQCIFSTCNRIFVILFLGDPRFRLFSIGAVAGTVVFWVAVRFGLMHRLIRLKQTESNSRTKMLGFFRNFQEAKISFSLLGKDSFLVQSFNQANDSCIQASLAYLKASSWIIFLVEIFGHLFLALLFIRKQDSNTFDRIFLYATVSDLGFFLYWSLEHSLAWQEYLAIFKRLRNLLGTKNESEIEGPSAKSPFQIDNSSAPLIKFTNISLEKPLIFRNLSLEIFPTGPTWITGRTGIGKSTIFSLFLGMYPKCCYSGSLLIRPNVKFSIVPQQPSLFFGCSLRFNIDPESLIDSDLELFQIMQQSNLEKGISLDSIVIPNAYWTCLRTRRRIGIARVLCRAKKSNSVLLFDETFDDKESYQIIPSDCTSIIITHGPVPAGSKSIQIGLAR